MPAAGEARVDSLSKVEVGDDVIVRLEKPIPGVPGTEVTGKVREKGTFKGKEYVDVSGVGSVFLNPPKSALRMLVFKVGAPESSAEAAPTGGKRRKSRRSTKKSRSTRRR